MTEVHPNLFVGSRVDYEYECANPNFFFVQVAPLALIWRHLKSRERTALLLKPERLAYIEGNHLILTMADAEAPAGLATYGFRQAVDFIHCCLGHERKVLAHSAHGLSRAPSIALVYMARFFKLDNASFRQAELAFKKIHPAYAPDADLGFFLELHWTALMGWWGSDI